MSVILPSRSVILEIARRQSKLFSVSEIEMDDKKLSAALAWPRLMIKSEPAVNVFQVAASLLTGILSEKPVNIGNPHLAFILMMIILRRNGVVLDITNQDAFKIMSAVISGQLEEDQLVKLITEKSIPQAFTELT